MNTVSQPAALAVRSSGVARWVATMGLAVLAAVATTAWADGSQPSARAGLMPVAMFGGHGGHGGDGGWMMGRGLDRMLDSVNATDAQRTQIRQIAEAARQDLRAQREAHRGLRDRAMAAFAQPNVNAREVEAVRQQMLAQHDAGSRRITQAMLDVSRVLTPEQRSQLTQRMRQRTDEMRRRMEERSRPGAPTT